MNTIYQFPTLGFIQGIGTPELLIICFVLLLLFGAKKLPELARGMGKSIKELKKGMSEIEEDFKTEMETTETPAKPVTPAQSPTRLAPSASPFT